MKITAHRCPNQHQVAVRVETQLSFWSATLWMSSLDTIPGERPRRTSGNDSAEKSKALVVDWTTSACTPILEGEEVNSGRCWSNHGVQRTRSLERGFGDEVGPMICPM